MSADQRQAEALASGDLMKSQMLAGRKGDDHLEHCWVLVGGEERMLWWGYLRKMTKGSPTSVAFDADYVMKMEATKKNVIGFYHTHPGFTATPSERDHKTMGAWVNCLGKPLICVIRGVDGLRGWWYDDDENEPVECHQVKQFKGLMVGTTGIPCDEIDDDLNEKVTKKIGWSAEWQDYLKELKEGDMQQG